MPLDIKHIWWDLDGTLYKTTPPLRELTDNRRYALFSESTKKPLNFKLKQEYRSLYKKYGSHSAVFMAIGKPKDFWQRTFQRIDLTTCIRPDQRTADMFQKFKKFHYAHSLFTNRKIDDIHRILTHLKIDPAVFGHILTNEDVRLPKPYPDGFMKMVHLSRVGAHKILYVGDRIETDILPAKKVGIKTALVWSENKKTEADYTFPHVADVLTLFR